MLEHKYKIKYDIKHEVGNFSKEDIQENGSGGTDAFVLFSIIYPEDGSYSQTHFSLDGRTGEALDRNELWKLWSTLSALLAKSDGLAEWKRFISETAFEMVREVIKDKE